MGSGGRSPRQWNHESAVFLIHIVALLRPGTQVPVFKQHPVEPRETDGWNADHTLLIEEGRRQLDHQLGDLERIRGRSQFLFTTALALLTGVVASAKVLLLANVFGLLLWFGAVVLGALGMLGAASLTATSGEFRGIDAASLTYSRSPIKSKVAAAYARSVKTGANTVATRLTLYRDAVFCLVVGAALFGTAWIIELFRFA